MENNPEQQRANNDDDFETISSTEENGKPYPNPPREEESSSEEELFPGEKEKKKQDPTIGDPTYGCKHYRRRCQKKCPTCNLFYTCRHCHDDVHYYRESDPEKNHKMDTPQVKEVKCLVCGHEQIPAKSCISCKIEFASYFCPKCNVFDNYGEAKRIFHCDGCGFCRVGGKENSFHCDTCMCCLDISMKKDHQCIQGSLKQDCVVCLDDMYQSRLSSTVLRCGHAIHSKCLKSYLKKGHIACPLCKKSVVDPRMFEEHFDQELASTPMPDEYKDTQMVIMCNDCLVRSRVPFHIYGGKCSQCRSYNTTQIREEEEQKDESQVATSQVDQTQEEGEEETEEPKEQEADKKSDKEMDLLKNQPEEPCPQEEEGEDDSWEDMD